MDERYYMLGGLGLLLVVLVVYLVVMLVGYRRAVRRVRAAAEAAEANGENRYLHPSAETIDDVFAAPVGRKVPEPMAPAQPVVLPQPLPQVYDFDIPQVRTAPLTTTSPEPEPAMPPEPAAEALEEPTPAFGGAPAFVAEPVSALEPALEPEPERELTLEAAPERELEFAPEQELEPEPEPELADATEPSSPGSYSLADDLERLMAVAETPPPLLTAAEHEAAVSTPTPEPEGEPPFEIPVEPLFPMPSLGQALSVVPTVESEPAPEAELELEREPAPAPEPAPSLGQALSTMVVPADAPAPAPAPAPEPALSAPHAPEPSVPEYRLVAPVELHFTSGGSRIGVKPGTRSFAEFQRLAKIMLDDLRTARGW